MPQIINTNVASLNSARNLSNSQTALATSLQRLSSGLRVNSAKDDAAGLAIAERMNAQVDGMNVAIRNANDGISYAQTAEGALAKVGDALQRMRELAVQSRNSTNSASDKDSLNTEFGQMQDEITRILGGTKFNGAAIFATSGSINFQVGAGTTTDDSISVNFGSTAFNANTTITGCDRQRRVDRQRGRRDRHRHRDRQPRYGTEHDQRRARQLGRTPDPLRVGDRQPAGLGREPERRTQPDHGRRLRRGNRRPVAQPDPAAGRYRDAGSGERAAAECALAAPLTDR